MGEGEGWGKTEMAPIHPQRWGKEPKLAPQPSFSPSRVDVRCPLWDCGSVPYLSPCLIFFKAGLGGGEKHGGSVLHFVNQKRDLLTLSPLAPLFVVVCVCSFNTRVALPQTILIHAP